MNSKFVLEKLRLNLGSWAIIDTYSIKNIHSDNTVFDLCRFIKANKNTLKDLTLEMRSWGYNKNKIT